MSQAESTPTTTRRTLLQGAISAPVVAASMLPQATAVTHATERPSAAEDLIRLGHELRAAWMHERKLAALSRSITDDEWEGEYNRFSALADKMVECSDCR